jgi:5-methylthioadenosine/S-adenosylhomocysteine deaminase
MQIDTLINARWIIPVEPDKLVLEHHSLGIEGGRIKGILPTHRAKAEFQAGEVVDLPQHALVPGFVNAHSHAAMSLLRGIADDLPLMEWLTDHIWPLEARWISESFVRDGTDLAMAEMLRSGITCFNDMYFFPDIVAQGAMRAGMRASVGMILVDFPTAWAANPDEYLAKGIRLHDELRHQSLVQTTFAPHAPYTVSDAPLTRIRTLSAELDRPVHIHLHETTGEIEQSQSTHGMRPLKRLQQLDLLNRNLLAVHMTQLTDDEIRELAHTGASVVHCPESNLKLASGFCPLDRLLKAGVNVALGTDGAASNNDLDILGEMRTAALLGKAVAGDASAVPAAAALRMATLNGAKALGIEDETGSLTVKKSADITAINLDTLETLPLYDPISDIVYAASRQQVTDVWVAGRRLLANRRLTRLDQDDIRRKAIAWRERLTEKTSART